MGRNRRRAKRLSDNGEGDRLSSLPDNLLITILSLMPISSAVATSVLSRRWRYLWTHITHMFFDWVYEYRFCNIDNSINRMSHLFSKLNSPKIHTFHMRLFCDRIQDQSFSLLAPTVHEICLRNPEFSEVGLPSFDNLANLSIDGFHLGSSDWMPSCLLSNVKNIKIEDIEPNDYGIRLLQGILSIATALQQLQVSLIDYYGINPITRVGEEYQFAMKLFALPKSSPNCHINLSGWILTASSENFNDGQLNCKLVDRIE